MRRRANDALQQLATHPTLPGILVLDVNNDGLARNGLSNLARWAPAKPQLGVVILVDREFINGRDYGNVRVIRGPRFAEVAQVTRALQHCASGHTHYQPMCIPEQPCPASLPL